MDKRKEANLRVKKSISKTLFSLMEEKNLAEITITELVAGANVARASFYRNYSSKEDVLVTMIRDILDACAKELDFSQDTFYTYENVLVSFQYFHKYREYILDLYRTGFTAILLEELNRFHESIEGNMPSSSIEKYELYIYIGALFNTAITWLSNEGKISAEDLARYFYHMVVGEIGASEGRVPAGGI